MQSLTWLLKETVEWGVGAAILAVLLLWATCIGCRLPEKNANVHSVYVYTAPSCRQCQLDKVKVEILRKHYKVVVVVCNTRPLMEVNNVSLLPTYRVFYVDGTHFETNRIDEVMRRL